MKRFGNLYDSMTSWDNLYLAAKNAQKGKRYRNEVLRFNYDLEHNLRKLQDELMTQTYKGGGYKTFEVMDNKKRIISAAPYRDRVVHHAICQIVVPIYERSYIHHSYAYRKCKGTHSAVELLKKYVTNHQYIFRADIQKYFPSIDHEILKRLLSRKIKCQKTLWLLETVIDSASSLEGFMDHFAGDDLFTPIDRSRGLPIGNLTSQHFANIYLNPLDHFVQEELKCSAYIRYVDDFVLLSNSLEQLVEWKERIKRFLEDYRLRFHPVKSQIFSVNKGISFLGYRIFPNHVRVLSSNVRRTRKRMNKLVNMYESREISLADVKQRLMSWIAHVSHADSKRLKEKVICPLVFQRGDGAVA